MRLLFALFLMTSLVGCRCGPDRSTPVTLRVKNTSNDPIFLNDTDALLGLKVQRYVNGEVFPFDETPRCACLACEQACSCSCTDEPKPFVRKLLPGQQAERPWSGVVQVNGTAACGLSGTAACLTPENAPGDETFSLKLCFALQVPGINLPDGGRTEGSLPQAGVSCVTRDFRPIDGVAEISPPKGSQCTDTTPCIGSGELCFSGSCTSSCPDNGYPTLGANWALRIPTPDDQGFFTVAPMGTNTLYTGTGTLSSVLYQGTTMVARLSRKGPANENLTGAVYVTLPPGPAAPLPQGEIVSVKLIDASTKENPENRAVVFRNAAGDLLFAADNTQQGSVLSATDTAPFAVSFKEKITGCRKTECGKQLFFETAFTSASATTLLEAGQNALQVTPVGTYRALNVFDASYASTSCKLFNLRPWALWREKAP